MNRTLEQWRNCDPKSMAHNQSDAAKQFAFEDAKTDILELAKEIDALREQLRVMTEQCAELRAENERLSERLQGERTRILALLSGMRTEEVKS